MSGRAALVRSIRAGGPQLSVGLFAGDLGRLQDERDRVEAAGARLLHLDVADGRYTPFFLGSPPLVAATSGSALLDVHLLVEDPLACVPDVVAAGASIVTFHPDAAAHPHHVLEELTAAEGPHGPPLRGLALRPGLGVEQVATLLPLVDVLLIVAINPGRRRRGMEPATHDRVRAARAAADAADHEILVATDGGVEPDGAAALVECGADYLVSGGAVFRAPTAAEGMAAYAAALARGQTDAPG